MRRLTMALGLALATCLPATAGAAVAPEYFTLPAGYDASSWGVTADEQGNVWFGGKAPNHPRPSDPAEQQPTPALLRLVPAQAVPGTSNGITGYPTPEDAAVTCCGNQLRSVVYNVTDHKLYWVRSDGHLGWGDPATFQPGGSTGMFTYRLPGNQDLWDVAAAQGPGVWFTEHSYSNVGPAFYGDRIAFSTGGAPLEGPNVAIQDGNTAINGQRYAAQPAGIAVDGSGRPWFVEENPGGPGYRIATWSGTGSHYDEYLLCATPVPSPCSGSNTGIGLSDVAAGGDGGLWFTDVLKKEFGRFDPDTHQFTRYTMASIGLPQGEPRKLASAPDGSVWMTSYQSLGGTSSALVRIVPPAVPGQQPGYSVFPLGGTTALGVGVDRAGSVWFTTSTSGTSTKVGRLADVVGVPAGPPAPGPAAAPVPPVVTQPTAVLTPATAGTARLEPPQVGNGAINTNQICVGPPEAKCSVIYMVREHEYVTAFPSAKKKAKKKKPRTLATKAVTLKGGESREVTIKLNKLGMRILKGQGKVKVDYVVTQKLAGGKTKTLSRKTLTMRYKKPKKGKAKRSVALPLAHAAKVKRGYYIEVGSQTYIQTNKAATKIARLTLPCVVEGEQRGGNVLTSLRLSKAGAFEFDGKSTLRGLSDSVIKLEVTGRIKGNQATAKVTYADGVGCAARSIKAKYYGVNPQG